MKELFLDANAHIPVNNAGMKAFVEFNTSSTSHSHPNGITKLSREASNLIEQSRATIAKLIGAEANQIVFTNSCTQACQWALNIFGKKCKYTISPFEHPAIQDYVDEQNRRTRAITVMEVSSDGVLSKPETEGSVVVLMQNEMGSIQPIKKLKNQYLLSDMSQALGKIPLDVQELDVDLATFGCHKYGGLGGVGFMYIKNPAWWMGFGTGSRYYTDIVGTPFVAGIVSSAAALTEAIETLPNRTKKMQEFQNTLEPRLEAMGLEIIGKNLERSPNTTFATGFEGTAALLLLQLSEKGIYLGLGSACGSVNVGSNRMLKALGREKCGVHDSLRISTFGQYGKEEANYVADMIKELWVKN